MLEKSKDGAGIVLVAIDRETGKIAGFLNGLSTDEEVFRDDFFTGTSLYVPEGEI